MKDFLKTIGAVILGLIIVNLIGILFFVSLLGSLGENKPVMPRSAVLKIDFAKLQLDEQTKEFEPMTMLMGDNMDVSILGILDATRALEAAASDPAVKFVYMKPDAATGGMAEIEEFRKALLEFRKSGKAVISYIESPTNAGYYLASASDKVFMTAHPGGMNDFLGLSSTLIYYKDLLDKLGVKVQLIRHGKYKSAGEPYIKSTPSQENLEQNREMITSIWNAWTAEMAAARNIAPEQITAAINELKLDRPADFIEEGLVDEIVTTEDLKAKIASYANVEKFSQVSQISISDYAALKVVPNYSAGRKVAVIYAQGEIVPGTDPYKLSSDRFVEIISDVRNDDDVKAVVFRVDSPGGSVIAADKIKDEIALLAAEKPVIASYGNYAASGGYWISAGCERIFANKSTLTGSIGVFSMIPDFSGAVDKIANLNIYTVKSNSHSDMLSMMRPLTDKEIAYMQGSVEEIYDKFTTIVAEGRGIDKDYVDSIAQGRVWSGVDAERIKLTDSEGTLMDALRYAVSVADEESSNDLSTWEIAEYPKPLGIFESIMAQVDDVNTVKIFKDTPFSGIEKAYKDLTVDRKGHMYARMPYEIIIK